MPDKKNTKDTGGKNNISTLSPLLVWFVSILGWYLVDIWYKKPTQNKRETNDASIHTFNEIEHSVAYCSFIRLKLL